VPAAAQELINQHGIPAALFNRIYGWMGGMSMKSAARKHGVEGMAALLARPYERKGGGE
jgi:hypothetical protein